MVWFIFALLSAVFRSLHEFATKKFLSNTDKYVLASGTFFITGLLLLISSIYTGIPELGEKFYLAVISTVILNIAIVILTFSALKKIDLSLAAPISSFTPLFLILTSFIILKEIPTKYGVIGILFIVVGSYILNFDKNKNLLEPIKQIYKNKGILYLFIAAFIASISSSFDKMVVLNSNITFGTSIAYFLLSLIFFLISIIKNKNNFILYYRNIKKFLIVGVLIFLGGLGVNIAYTLQKAAYVSAINRFHILLAIIYGGTLLKEKNILNRFIGGLMMVIGMIIITLFG